MKPGLIRENGKEAWSTPTESGPDLWRPGQFNQGWSILEWVQASLPWPRGSRVSQQARWPVRSYQRELLVPLSASTWNRGHLSCTALSAGVLAQGPAYAHSFEYP